MHEETETLSVEVNIPDHKQQKATYLFEKTGKTLIKREGDQCYICGRTSVEQNQ